MRWSFAGLGETSSAAFRQWFRDSKIVDGAGRPLRVYHGASHPIEAFRHQGEARHGQVHGRGFYFTPNRSYAESFAYGEDPTVVEAYLSVQNPLVLVEGDAPAWAKAFPSGAGADEITRRARRAGYDGIVIRSGRYLDQRMVEVVVFEPTQIKAATNRGNFDPANPNIFAGAR